MALESAGDPAGVDAPLPRLQMPVVPVDLMALFGTFVTPGFLRRRDVQGHKRYVHLASLGLLDAAIARWPFAIMTAAVPVPGFSVQDLFVDAFLVPMVAWDVASRGRPHPDTLWGGLVLVASQPLKLLLARTDAWSASAARAVGVLGR